MKRVIQVVSSNSSTLALTANGEVWGWGPGNLVKNTDTSMGDDDDDTDLIDPWVTDITKLRAHPPARVVALSGHRITRIAAATPGGSSLGFAAITGVESDTYLLCMSDFS